LFVIVSYRACARVIIVSCRQLFGPDASDRNRPRSIERTRKRTDEFRKKDHDGRTKRTSCRARRSFVRSVVGRDDRCVWEEETTTNDDFPFRRFLSFVSVRSTVDVRRRSTTTTKKSVWFSLLFNGELVLTNLCPISVHTEPFPIFSLQKMCSHLNICYYHQDLRRSLFRPPSRTTFFTTRLRALLLEQASFGTGRFEGLVFHAAFCSAEYR